MKKICLNKSVLDYMAARVGPNSAVLEFGGGHSSKWFADRAGRLLTIESNRHWQDMIEADLEFAIAEWRVLPDFPTHLRAIVQFDLVLVDSEEHLRREHAEWGWRALKPGGVILFDDAQRPRHEGAVAWITARAGTPERLVWQPGDIEAAKPRLTLAWVKA